MDALSEALRDVRISGAIFLNADLTSPWGFTSGPSASARHVLAPGVEHLVIFHLLTEGSATVRVAGSSDDAAVALEAGDIVVLPNGDAHTMSNGPVRDLIDGATLLPKILSGSLAIERGGGGGAPTKFVCGYFGCERYAARLFLAGLPAVFKVSLRRDASSAWVEGALHHAIAEAQSDRPGRRALLAKLAETLFVQTLCRYMDVLPAAQTGWLAAARDEVVGRALACLHRDPARAWSLVELAHEAGASRTVLAEKFTRFLAQPPLAYLARFRLQRAARLLETTDDNVLRIALDVGYESEAAFNRAFKREFDLPPARYRRQKREAIETG